MLWRLARQPLCTRRIFGTSDSAFWADFNKFHHLFGMFVITLEQSCKLVKENRANYLKTILRFIIVPESDVLWKLE